MGNSAQQLKEFSSLNFEKRTNPPLKDHIKRIKSSLCTCFWIFLFNTTNWVQIGFPSSRRVALFSLAGFPLWWEEKEHKAGCVASFNNPSYFCQSVSSFLSIVSDIVIGDRHGMFVHMYFSSKMLLWSEPIASLKLLSGDPNSITGMRSFSDAFSSVLPVLSRLYNKVIKGPKIK